MTSDIVGLNGTLDAMKALPLEIQEKILKSATRQSATDIAKAAKQFVPKDTGILKKSIGIQKRRTKDKNILKFTIAPRTKMIHKYQDKLQAKRIAEGTIRKSKDQRKRSHRFNYAAQVEFGSSTNAPAAFMTKAYELEGPHSINNIKNALTKKIDKAIQKVKKS